MAYKKETPGTHIFNGNGDDSLDDIFSNSRIGHEKKVPIINAKTGEEIEYINSPGGQLSFDFSEAEIATAELTAVYEPEDESSTPRWIWHDPIIFDDESKRLFMELTPAQRVRFTADLMAKFYADRPEYDRFSRVHVYSYPLDLLELFKSLSIEDFHSCRVSNAETRFSILQDMIRNAEKAIESRPIDTENLATIWPILSIRELFLESELAAFYYLKNPKKSPKELAREKGAIMTIGGRLADISNKYYSGWLDERPNKYAYISYTGDKHYFDKINADPDGNLYEQLQRSISEQDKRARRAIKEGRFFDGRPPEHEHFNEVLLQALLKVALDNPRNNEDERYFYIHVPTLARELNEHYITSLDEYDESGNLKEEAAQQRKEGETTAYRPPNFMDLITDLNYWVGVINNMPTQIVSINQVDYESNTIRIDSPFIYDLIRAEDDRRQLDAEKRAAKKGYKIVNPGYDFLLHSSIATEKDKIAVDLARTIINKILQRGTKNYSDEENEKTEKRKDEPIDMKFKYKDLIDETPALKMAYNGASPKYKYDILNRKFKTAFKILKSKTDIYKYYVDLNIPNTPPTTRTLDSYLLISHRGINKEYKIKRT